MDANLNAIVVSAKPGVASFMLFWCTLPLNANKVQPSFNDNILCSSSCSIYMFAAMYPIHPKVCLNFVSKWLLFSCSSNAAVDPCKIPLAPPQPLASLPSS